MGEKEDSEEEERKSPAKWQGERQGWINSGHGASMNAAPGQPKMMHMGTNHLINDLWREVQKLRGSVNRTLDEALNSGDGTYRP